MHFLRGKYPNWPLTQQLNSPSDLLIPLVSNTEQESSEGSFRVNWENFNEETTSFNHSQSTAGSNPVAKQSSSETAEETEALPHNTVGYAFPLPKKPDEQVTRRTPSPLPKPYSRKSASNPSKCLS